MNLTHCTQSYIGATESGPGVLNPEQLLSAGTVRPSAKTIVLSFKLTIWLLGMDIPDVSS